jgi:crotonobetainyl-CoA:carnitine CoA-transferase CaiB-like acyl-CoA transferase
MLGVDVDVEAPSPPERPGAAAQRWAASGAMALTGYADGPALLPPVELSTAADGAALAFETLARVLNRHEPADLAGTSLDGTGLLAERAALLGLSRNGTTTPGGSCRLLPARDGWVALGLRRADDFELVPALIGGQLSDPGEPWPEITHWLAGELAADAVGRAQLLGLPAATPQAARGGPQTPWNIIDLGSTRIDRDRPALVVDLSTLWAGPLATSLLVAAGANVVKVESPGRPDGSRQGPAAFNDLMNAGKLSAAADLNDPVVRDLIDRADLVVTSARPRALEHLGLIPRPGRSWLTITGYGWHGPRRDWVAYGDDAAVAAGLVAGPADAPVFCADAVADPLTGLHAAVAAVAALTGSRHVHVDISLYGVSRYLRTTLPTSGDPAYADATYLNAAWAKPVAPHARAPRGTARALGADQDHPLVRGSA